MKNIIERVIMLYGYPADTPQKTAIWQNLKWLQDIFLFTAFSAGVLMG